MDAQKASQIQQNVYDLYSALDQLKPINALMLNQWSVDVPGIGKTKLPTDKIVSLTASYDALRIKVLALANALPVGQSLGQ